MRTGHLTLPMGSKVAPVTSRIGWVLRKLLPEWREMGTTRRAIEALWTPLAGGFGAGFGATVSTGAWAFNIFLAIVGAVTFGAQHRSQRVAVARAVLSGTLFGALVLVAYHVFGHSSDAPSWLLPPRDTLLFLLLFTASLPLHQLGTWLRLRLDPTPAPAPAPAPEPAVATARPVPSPTPEPAAAGSPRGSLGG